ncbi:hypothetical protein PTSG_02764 [Salpingoeca rosetta]|uniref:FUZ/MON1/HPS1 first Longin domain-containing protein n=1 Tax=Salpingoeca rosetta (strain ATCC 50818 / BSB-021) TaxID=946362 RepID=F2U390_SALR5|nr:uncharacterized protein PTSG_02764 [Salpingoeca rosetta]EGD82084.1 hypothetical protein PTSG_02764 [Salpingoeca rosetta]|eukprot:XP_004996267.1 hypothetical protein PTSG_02764 [Salpingoeca rosetta]
MFAVMRLSRAHRQLFYGIYKYVQRNEHELTSTVTEGARITWRSFEPGIFFIFVHPNEHVEDTTVDSFVQLLFNSLTFLLSKESLSADATSLRLSLRACFGFIDHLLQEHNNLALQLGCMEVALSGSPAELQEVLNTFCEHAESNYGALLVGGRCVAATEPFWELSSTDTCLVCAYAAYLPASDAFDGPVFLPTLSPDVPHRFVRLRLLHNVYVVLLCGARPALHTLVQQLVPSIWKGILPLLQDTARLEETGLPPSSSTVHESVLGVLAVDPVYHRCLVTTPSPDVQLQHTRCPTRRILRAWYKQILDARHQLDTDTQQLHETYSCHETYSTYAILRPTCHVLVVLAPSLPTYALKAVAQETAATLSQLGLG